MLAFSVRNSRMTFDLAENEEPTSKRRRYLVINEEIYVEFPEVVDGTHKKHLIPITEANFNEEVQAEEQNVGSANLGALKCCSTGKNCNVENPASHECLSEEKSKDVNSSEPNCGDKDSPDKIESLENIETSNNHHQGELQNIDNTNLEDLKSPSTSKNDIDVKTVSKVGSHENLSERKSEVENVGSSDKMDSADDDSSDEMIIVSDDEQLNRKETMNSHLENSETTENFIQSGIQNIGSTNHFQEPSSTSMNCVDVANISKAENIASHNENLSKTNSEDISSSETNSYDSCRDVNSDEMIIVSDDKQLRKKKKKSCEYEYSQKISFLIKSFENNVRSQHSNQGEAQNIIGIKNNCVKKSKVQYEIDHSIKMGKMDHFPIRFWKRATAAIEGVHQNDQTNSETTQTCTSKIIECPYCNFKLTRGRLPRHLLVQHLETCYCFECELFMTCGKFQTHNRKHLSNSIKCVLKCSFETNDMEKFRRHLIAAHTDELLRQCCICGKWMERIKPIEDQIQSLVEHVKSNHLLQPNEEA